MGIFIKGEKVDLTAPLDSDFETWGQWFNDEKITRYMDIGVGPFNATTQKKFYHNSLEADRFLALIKSREEDLLGVTSLSEINYQNKSCQISSVCPVFKRRYPLAALEGRALTVKYAFEELGMNRIYSGNVYPGNYKWYQSYSTLGFSPEGVFKSYMYKNRKFLDVLRVSLLYDDYKSIKTRRGGDIWLGEEKMMKLIKGYRKNETSGKKLYQIINEIKQDNNAYLRSIEADFV